jgi:hypothetical protein
MPGPSCGPSGAASATVATLATFVVAAPAPWPASPFAAGGVRRARALARVAVRRRRARDAERLRAATAGQHALAHHRAAGAAAGDHATAVEQPPHRQPLRRVDAVRPVARGDAFLVAAGEQQRAGAVDRRDGRVGRRLAAHDLDGHGRRPRAQRLGLVGRFLVLRPGRRRHHDHAHVASARREREQVFVDRPRVVVEAAADQQQAAARRGPRGRVGERAAADERRHGERGEGGSTAGRQQVRAAHRRIVAKQRRRRKAAPRRASAGRSGAAPAPVHRRRGAPSSLRRSRPRTAPSHPRGRGTCLRC